MEYKAHKKENNQIPEIAKPNNTNIQNSHKTVPQNTQTWVKTSHVVELWVTFNSDGGIDVFLKYEGGEIDFFFAPAVDSRWSRLDVTRYWVLWQGGAIRNESVDGCRKYEIVVLRSLRTPPKIITPTMK